MGVERNGPGLLSDHTPEDTVQDPLSQVNPESNRIEDLIKAALRMEGVANKYFFMDFDELVALEDTRKYKVQDLRLAIVRYTGAVPLFPAQSFMMSVRGGVDSREGGRRVGFLTYFRGR